MRRHDFSQRKKGFLQSHQKQCQPYQHKTKAHNYLAQVGNRLAQYDELETYYQGQNWKNIPAGHHESLYDFKQHIHLPGDFNAENDHTKTHNKNHGKQ